MAHFLLTIDNHTDETTKQMLLNLIEKKLKYTRYKNIHFLITTTAILYGFFAFYVIYKIGVEPYRHSVLDGFSAFVNNSHFLTLIMIAFVFFGSVKIIYDKKEKYEKEYHALRCEIIEKSKDLWKGEGWKERHKVFEKMKKIYDINLYHESK